MINKIPTLKVFRTFVENAPCQYIVTTRAWKGKVVATCDTELAAKLIALKFNSDPIFLTAVLSAL